MYIAHLCPACNENHVVFSINGTGLYSCSCRYTENEAAFWEAYRSEGFCRELESEIDDRFPDKSISILRGIINIAVGWHILGNFKARDKCITSALTDAKRIYETWQICFCDFAHSSRVIEQYDAMKSEEDDKYSENKKTVKAAFESLPSKLKELYT